MNLSNIFRRTDQTNNVNCVSTIVVEAQPKDKVNLNGMASSFDGQQVVCRHLAAYAYMTDIATATQSFTSVKAIESIP